MNEVKVFVEWNGGSARSGVLGTVQLLSRQLVLLEDAIQLGRFALQLVIRAFCTGNSAWRSGECARLLREERQVRLTEDASLVVVSLNERHKTIACCVVSR